MLKTMALVINEKNYSLVSACLPAGFLAVPPAKTYGCVLVINDVRATHKQPKGSDKNVVIGNSWMTMKQFFEDFDETDLYSSDSDPYEFVPVTRSLPL